MHDAIVLANCIYNMKSVTQEGITATFEDYYGQRYHRLNAQFKRSQALSAITTGQVRIGKSNRVLYPTFIRRTMANSRNTPCSLAVDTTSVAPLDTQLRSQVDARQGLCQVDGVPPTNCVVALGP